MTVNSRSVRRLRRGGVAVELDYDAAHVLLTCEEHKLFDRTALVDDDLGMILVRFFRDHQECSVNATFQIEDDVPVDVLPAQRIDTLHDL